MGACTEHGEDKNAAPFIYLLGIFGFLDCNKQKSTPFQFTLKWEARGIAPLRADTGQSACWHFLPRTIIEMVSTWKICFLFNSISSKQKKKQTDRTGVITAF